MKRASKSPSPIAANDAGNVSAFYPRSLTLKRAERHRAAILDAIEKGTFDYAVTFCESHRAEQFAERKGDVETLERYMEKWLDRQTKIPEIQTLADYKKIIHTT